MSKLSKFRQLLNMPVAAKLLSDLISEKVDTEDLMSLYESGWLRLFHPCNGELVKLKPALEPELYEQHARDGRYYLEEDYVAGVCFGFYLPCDFAEVSMRRSYILRDGEGGMYAIRDSQTDDLFAPHRDEELEKKVMAVTSDLYSLADKANTHAMPAKKEFEVSTNDHCICIGQTIYNFTPSELPDLREADQIIKRETPPPSLRITVAALLEAATSERRTHTQASLIETILERNRGIRGLSESSLQKHFSDSNAELSRLRKSIQN